MTLTLAFLLTALAAYVLFGGADFGGGILEATLGKHPHLQKKVQKTLAPVWEANHVWLIAVIVILFVGFPTFYAALCTALFVPLSLALVGIAVRGAFFTFRKYDPEPLTRERCYSWLFYLSSMLTPMMFGFIVAALLQPFPVLREAAPQSFPTLYIFPWATTFGLLCACFVFSLFGYVASVFFFGELEEPADRKVIERRVWQFFGATFVFGGIVLTSGVTFHIVPLANAISSTQIMVQFVALVCILLMAMAVRTRRIWGMRLVAGVQVLCILAGWFSTQYPVFMKFQDGNSITVASSAAPAVTLFSLNTGLAVALSAVIPLLAYLYRVFSSGVDRVSNR